MRIAMLAPISWRVPPRHYGPWERVVSLLTEGLVERNVDVTLFATADSITRARLVGVCPRPYSEDPNLDAKVWECLHIAAAFERYAEFDLIHNHFDFLPLSYSRLVPVPVVTTIHGFSSERILPVYQAYQDHAYYVSISNADRHPSLRYIATIYHGIDLDEFTLQTQPGDYLLFFGRIHPDKGTAEAIEVAKRSHRRLIIAGIVHDQTYFEQEVAPHLDGDQIRYVGSVGPPERDTLLGGAFALLHMVNFAEPFGLSLIEAMACGTPVIARPLGAIPEIVKPGLNGFFARDIDEAIQALRAIPQLDRKQIRADVAARFSRERMVDEYLTVYQQVIELYRQKNTPARR